MHARWLVVIKPRRGRQLRRPHHFRCITGGINARDEALLLATARFPLIAATLYNIPLRALALKGPDQFLLPASSPRKDRVGHSRLASCARHQAFRDMSGRGAAIKPPRARSATA